MAKKRARHDGRTTGKTRRAAEPGTPYTGRVEDLANGPWRDRVGSDMNTQTGFTPVGTPVLICIPTHELHVLSEDGVTSVNTWAEGLPLQRFRQITDLNRLDEIGVDVDWTVTLGPASRLPSDPRFVTLTGAVRGPSPTGAGVALFYQGTINTSPEWIDKAKRLNKLIIVAKARQGAENWAVAAHLNRPST
ncbi:hypothetical protein [Saccharothrix sp.]|uniref:hypothetical protein n=1 Tax=Saccharothrix sp. TaxID=1873460 RepID=UPI00281123A3|nr:hypothetical protein [Saccharothrix sp.]